MKNRGLLAITCLVLLAGCQASAPQPLQSREAAEGDWKLPYEYWQFMFFTPFALYADVTVVQIIDVDGYLNRFYTLDSTDTDPKVKGTWSNYSRGALMAFNKAKSLPQYMMFCWDSIIDKKTYETSIVFSPEIWRRMKTPAEHLDYDGHTVWYDTLAIGLAPEGKVRLWLQDVGNHPNIPITPNKIITRSGKEMKFCQGITNYPNGYSYFGETPEYIKGKTYPYGSW
ncbi:hypothetical protein C7387_0412 [Yokenella regensburgei]|uniref:DUF2931 family protein n=1 Tax=Yokenella regensburgei TaxID=158877 RepID=A0ABX9RYW5_9ENTR|nr:DUF2931 family protein [Yokenella regensburgei]RKR63748.1 hypothetical protein C7387_0412 [Yokenella regensburgei]VFS32058.1 Protein of uncharacterised function (DUF2931) [Yokenella regensburgei]